MHHKVIKETKSVAYEKIDSMLEDARYLVTLSNLMLKECKEPGRHLHLERYKGHALNLIGVLKIKLNIPNQPKKVNLKILKIEEQYL